jgi:hypothetical protein
MIEPCPRRPPYIRADPRLSVMIGGWLDGTGDAAADLWVRLLDALERPCPMCGGRGTMPSPQWRAWRARTDELVRVVEAARRAATLPNGGEAPRLEPPEPPYPEPPYMEPGYGDDPQTDPNMRFPYDEDPYGDLYDGDIDPGEGMLRAIVARAGRQPIPGLPREDPVPRRPPTGPQPTVPIAAARPPEPPAAIVSALDRAINEHIRAKPTGPEVVVCQECGGGGRALTEAGVRFTRFLARHGLVRTDRGPNGQGPR